MSVAKTFKIVCIGLESTGIKTLIEKYSDKEEFNSYYSLVGAQLFQRKERITIQEYVNLELRLLSSESAIKSLSSRCLDDADGLIMVFDVTNKYTFDFVTQMMQIIRSEFKGLPIFLIGNKCELPVREIELEDAIKLSKKFNCSYINFVSTSLGQNVDDIFITFAENLVRKS